jgi:hypothetical protein
MSVEPVTPVNDSDFKADGVLEAMRLVLRLRGNADLRTKEKLDVFLAAADERALSARVEEVAVDFRDLVFMNSSCLKAMVTWLTKVQDRPNAEQYRIVFIKQPTAHWQTRSLNALLTFAPGLVQIE